MKLPILQGADWRGAFGGAPVAAAEGEDPKVRPGVFKYAGAFASADPAASVTAAVKPRGSAPFMVLITSPLRKIMNVGMERTEYLEEMSRWESTSTFTNVTARGRVCSEASLEKMGAMVLHGPHQSA